MKVMNVTSVVMIEIGGKVYKQSNIKRKEFVGVIFKISVVEKHQVWTG